MNDGLRQRTDGTYEEALSAAWSAEYAEDRDTGLWSAEVFHRGAAEWRGEGFATVEEARYAAKQYYDAL